MLWLPGLAPVKSLTDSSLCPETSFKMTQLGYQGNSLDEDLAGFGGGYVRQNQLGSQGIPWSPEMKGVRAVVHSAFRMRSWWGHLEVGGLRALDQPPK